MTRKSNFSLETNPQTGSLSYASSGVFSTSFLGILTMERGRKGHGQRSTQLCPPQTKELSFVVIWHLQADSTCREVAVLFALSGHRSYPSCVNCSNGIVLCFLLSSCHSIHSYHQGSLPCSVNTETCSSTAKILIDSFLKLLCLRMDRQGQRRTP